MPLKVSSEVKHATLKPDQVVNLLHGPSYFIAMSSCYVVNTTINLMIPSVTE